MPSGAGNEPAPGPNPDRAAVGVVAQQGGFAAHLEHLASAGANPSEVREPGDLEGLDGLILPGGESTTIAMGLERDGLGEAIIGFAGSGKPVMGTCAGMILLGRDHLGLLDATVRRNAFGRQLASFEQDLDLAGLAEGEPFRAIFIRAPWIEQHGAGVEVLAEVEGHPVGVRQSNVLALSFHPELSDDDRIHAGFVADCLAARDSGDR